MEKITGLEKQNKNRMIDYIYKIKKNKIIKKFI